MIVQLDPTLPMTTPKGKGFAHFLIDYGQEHHLLWVVFLDETGGCWTFPNPEVRLQPNPTMETQQKKPDLVRGPGEHRWERLNLQAYKPDIDPACYTAGPQP